MVNLDELPDEELKRLEQEFKRLGRNARPTCEEPS
jgi:hypothetical protein